ncbi:HAD-IIA family hydrolase [Rhodococcus coprophilus]|uniref:Phosphatase n=1 Tax=Rhodococcus coprophilus TaxID=38310 RepID=A0A2X4WWT1_9NOCA|nr:HAD-IIA family hydrolase [Rhodococcus coprophilus]MBM7460727.1 HAD superfamily hydrolase (TIGR01450 family) [Rhodococcus coprophilus]SQI28534.1 phosphatase [Rhodococcus coprophilus]
MTSPGGAFGHAPAELPEETLRSLYDVLLLDLDGTVYRGAHAVPGAREALTTGDKLFYVTNNASRRPGEVAHHLRDLGFPAEDASVVTSSQSAARLLAEQVPAGSPVLVVGTEALAEEVARVGLVPVRTAAAEPVAVVQGHSPETGWAILAEATLAIRAGAWWVATNIDSTLPTERGLVLGNGSMVAAVRHATGAVPVVAGKPAAPLLEDAIRRSAAERPLVVGDRLDTDIEGANAVGADSLLVLTGVSTVDDLLRAPAEQRPTYVGASLSCLDAPVSETRVAPGGTWSIRFDGEDLHLQSSGEAGDAMEVLRGLLGIAWSKPGFRRVVPGDEHARNVLAEWAIDL